jgi:sugar phosphate isomerase/epimerase
VDLSCCLWALTAAPDSVEAALEQVAGIGFELIDVQPHTAGAEQIRKAGLRTSCVAVSAGAPKDAALHADDASSVSAALTYAYGALEYAAGLGATTAYVVPDPASGQEALPRYARALALVADRAFQLDLRLCVEHFPGTPLPSVAATVGYLREIGHPNLHLVFDIGHAQMSKENPPAAITAAGPLLGYVHLDDNDGVGDQHLALLDGVMKEEDLSRTFAALAASPYAGPVSLELHPTLPDPAAALRRSRELVQRLLASN